MRGKFPVMLQATPLSTMQVATLPTHDPLIGRIVGGVFAGQAAQHKPEKASLEGTINGTDKISITFTRQSDGTVQADGQFGTLEIHDKFQGATLPPDGPEARLFGVGPGEAPERVARSNGSVGGNFEKTQFNTERSSEDVPLTEPLRSRATQAMGMRSKVTLGETFGGGGVPVMLTPGQGRQETPAIRTTDTVSARGSIGDVGFGRALTWNMTTWAVSYNTREGWSGNDMYAVEDASEKIYVAGKGETTSTPIALQITVDNGVVEARGTLRTERDGQAAVETPVSRTYARADGGVAVTEQFADQKISFTIAAAK